VLPGVHPLTVTNWEHSRTNPALRFLPGILALLSFDPSSPTTSPGERLRACRRRAGLSQERLARLLGIDPSTLSRWERNLRDPTGRYARLAVTFLGHCERGICPDRNGVAFRLQLSPTR